MQDPWQTLPYPTQQATPSLWVPSWTAGSVNARSQAVAVFSQSR
jgi:hypothetical protein